MAAAQLDPKDPSPRHAVGWILPVGTPLLLNATRSAELLGMSRQGFYSVARRQGFLAVNVSDGMNVKPALRYSVESLATWIMEQRKPCTTWLGE